MSEMGGDEVLILLLGLVLSVITWWKWYLEHLSVTSLARSDHGRVILYTAPLGCAALTLTLLLTLAAHDVRSAPHYIAQYLLLGGAWVGIASRFFITFGISAREDVSERGNGAAGIAVAGGLLGVTLCYGGGNIGDGPGWGCVVFSAALSTGTFFLAWALFEKTGGVAEKITVERDVASAIRLAGFLTASGLVLGGSVAGDWTGAAETWTDFVRHGWPVMALVAAASWLERLLRPTVERPSPSVLTHGWLPALTYLGAAGTYVSVWWELP